MTLISTRSPFVKTFTGGLDGGFTLIVDIGYYEDTGDAKFQSLNTYNIDFATTTQVDLSPLIRSSIFSAGSNSEIDIETLVVKTSWEFPPFSSAPEADKIYTASDGWFKYEEGFNKDLSEELLENCFYAGSNDVIYKSDDESLRIPMFMPLFELYSAKIYFYKDGEVVSEVDTDFGYIEEQVIGGVFKSIYQTSNINTIINSAPDLNFKNRVLLDGGTIEDNQCIDAFFRNNEVYGVDEVVIEITYYPDGEGGQEIVSTKRLEVKDIVECKYEPYRVSFINRYGSEEDLWFFKRSDTTLNTEREMFRKNNVDAYMQGDLSNHNYKDFNVNGRETIKLNSGYLPESFYENFSQMHLSESVWIFVDGKKLPVNITESSLSEKKHVNDKLVNYTVELQYSFDRIGNIF
ncbi:MAG: hypothetical protein HRU18_11135 [Pseudoalteromonas sp.]|uniref:hypothetical protein n=1 Tax=Pseudoalteromonas sp. TaxID=53249 RepID=UPI001DD21DBB|nr:hypothetical protein [Pseudoalteromonas sp.]NRA78753.1 hypothetical protein [Pseudoalteromonas sp.]